MTDTRAGTRQHNMPHCHSEESFNFLDPHSRGAHGTQAQGIHLCQNLRPKKCSCVQCEESIKVFQMAPSIYAKSAGSYQHLCLFWCKYVDEVSNIFIDLSTFFDRSRIYFVASFKNQYQVLVWAITISCKTKAQRITQALLSNPKLSKLKIKGTCHAHMHNRHDWM